MADITDLEEEGPEDPEELEEEYLDDKSTSIQTLIFSKKHFKSSAAAIAWAAKHGFKHPKVDVTGESIRLRQQNPGSFEKGSFRTINLKTGVKAVIGKPSGDCMDNILCDVVNLSKPVKFDSGALKVDALFTRTGVFEYQDSSYDGGIRREYRPPDEVFDKAHLDSLEGAPVTIEHPPQKLTLDNVKQYMVGMVSGRPIQHGRFVRGSLVLNDSDAIQNVEAGKRQLSVGYSRDFDPTPGSFQGTRYDGITRNIRANHISIVEKGRAGPEASINMDTAEVKLVDILIKDASYTVDDAVAAEISSLRERVSELENTNLKLQDNKDAIRNRVNLLLDAAKYLGSSDHLDNLNDCAVKSSVIKHLTGLVTDGFSDEKIDGAYEMAILQAGKGNAGLMAARLSTVVDSQAPDFNSPEAKLAKQREEMKNLYKTSSKAAK